MGEQAIAVENEIEGLFERRILNANGHRVISDILVENEIDPSGLSNPFQDFFEPGIAKPKCHRLLTPIVTVQRLLLLGEFGDTLEGFLERGIQLSRFGIGFHGLVGPTELGEAICLSILAARIFQAKRFKQPRLMLETGRFDGECALKLFHREVRLMFFEIRPSSLLIRRRSSFSSHGVFAL